MKLIFLLHNKKRYFTTGIIESCRDEQAEKNLPSIFRRMERTWCYVKNTGNVRKVRALNLHYNILYIIERKSSGINFSGYH